MASNPFGQNPIIFWSPEEFTGFFPGWLTATQNVLEGPCFFWSLSYSIVFVTFAQFYYNDARRERHFDKEHCRPSNEDRRNASCTHRFQADRRACAATHAIKGILWLTKEARPGQPGYVGDATRGCSQNGPWHYS